jgi:formylglycine-generating enzyme required for sulfatase activity
MAEASGLELNSEAPAPAQASEDMPLSMVFVPPGDFIMGEHTVYLDSFWIDKTEVTNARYARCVQAGACSAPRSSRSNTRDPYYGNPRFDDYPVIYVSWEDGNRYCSWAGGRLPTEAEWEKAARGTDARPFPWGAEDPSVIVNVLNYRGQDTTEVGSYPSGASPYGALDMAGNVSEWVADWLSEGYYHNPPASDPTGPETGDYRVWRGGSWANTSIDRVRTYSRTGNLPTDASGGIGFRCARDPSP